MSRNSQPHRYPVSVKGVVNSGNRFLLLKNERDEWELPGGKLEPGETPEECVVREITEEVGLSVRVGSILDSWVYEVFENVHIVILTYGCCCDPFSEVHHSSEHKEAGLFTLAEIAHLQMPEGYKKSLHAWSEQINDMTDS